MNKYKNIKKISKFIFLLLSPCFIIISAAESYDNEVVHQSINENAAKQSASLLSTLINIGFNNGLDNVIYGKKIYKWFYEGARLEDETVCRSRNHFHDPLKPWDSAGLNNAVVNTYCLLLGLEKFSVDSSLIWSQKESLNPFFDNRWSWPKARNYYYKALTSTTKDDREQNFAYTFRALGQVTHLISDSSVPAHVRNDIHVFPLTVPGIGMDVGGETYESWARKNSSALDYTAKKVDQSIFTQAVTNSSAPVPISALWDQNKYTGTNPSVTWTTNPSISGFGLAEYTNANFFSEDTIFKDYPHPKKENTTARLVEQTAKDGKKDEVWYIQGYTSERLAAYSYLNKWLLPDKWEYNLDGYVYEDYASQLIPRAVGYSAGLLNYFFRGDIEMAPDNSTGSGYVIVNNTDEDINGTFELYYDNNSDQRIRIDGWSLSIGKKSSGNNRSTNVTFTKPTTMKEDGKYMLAFRGKLGSEEDAVAGRNVELKGGEYLFLVSVLSRKIQSFKIGILNGSYQLAPAEVNVNLTCSTDTGYPSLERILGRNLTIQSNPEKTEHYAVLPTVKLDSKGTPVYETYRDYINGYGVGQKNYCWSWWLGYVCEYTYSGSPFTYRPKDFTKGSEYILEKPGSQLLSDMYTDPQPVATGRKSYTLDNEGKMTSYQNSIWRKYISGYAYQYYFRYKEKVGGEWIDGSILATDELLPDTPHLTLGHRPIAFVDRDKALIISTHTETFTPNSTVEHLSATLHTTGVQKGYCSYSGEAATKTVTSDFVKDAVAEGISGDTYYFADELKFGDLTLEKCTYKKGVISDGASDFYRMYWKLLSKTSEDDCPAGDYFIWRGTTGSVTNVYNDFGVKKGYFPDPGCEYCGSMQYSDYEDYERGERIPQVIDYDNIDGENNFIIFYRKSVTDKKTWGKRSFYGDDGDAPLEAYHDSSYDDKYMMAYRINGGAITAAEIATARQKIIESRSAIDYDPATNSFTYEYNPARTETWSGQRITAVSCQANSDAIVYTYIIEKRVDDKWIFDKRVVGIMNISDKFLPIGYRQEFELDFSVTDFDPKSLATIGVHAD